MLYCATVLSIGSHHFQQVGRVCKLAKNILEAGPDRGCTRGIHRPAAFPVRSLIQFDDLGAHLCVAAF
jgi:hypothetical protein